ncbi:MBL fold metallo-hydrolase [Desulfuromonas acetoxidans]|uniref:Beta-lactamase-like n=1 Tax=Desulfuromonas acetoxidans (strain DSM 684 / 11070) TaxID=281689 RepID=Q1K1R4_DESA6|nr:MBL fold metallo-hydrolase [Desulfuromonas acetoxidans]EAT16324.1 beta-lactamase-like [Desulfuromonas acetoxidans DSM 684]MBF0645999.1 MBL fold metallo-hydrolase [Desulfuromonas acetoxidans]NVD23463.1 MBL fold metallo-hydrolase [Desulfuromonas acetoxidans]NVE16151.1 MBL fold metallo-hydrolase [Desulfuromonas acetoxidans]
MNVKQLKCIYLDQPQLEGFRNFISSWYIETDGFRAVVDPGPLSTIPVLVNALRDLQVESIDYILLTHIHIDHAGGTGELIKYFPEAQVICHQSGIKHMISPEKLWQGSLQVLGETAEVYGEIIPVPSQSIFYASEVGNSGIQVYETPGHAPHHVCYRYEDLVFGGEIAGVHIPVDSGRYMRPATPPRFIYEVARDSIDKMIAVAPRYLVIAHHGLVEPAVSYLQTARKQLGLWVKAVAVTDHIVEEQRDEVIYDWLLNNDPTFSAVEQLETDIYARERYFMSNSLRGIQLYYKTLPAEQQQAWKNHPS